MVAIQAHNLKVAGSSPAPATSGYGFIEQFNKRVLNSRQAVIKLLRFRLKNINSTELSYVKRGSSPQTHGMNIYI